MLKTLKILPLRKDAPIYMLKESWPEFGEASSVAQVAGVDVVEEHITQITPAR